MAALTVMLVAAAWVALARPKSSSLAPDLVSMIFPGFRSRWRIPLRCALSRPDAICEPYLQTCSNGSGPLRRRFSSVSPSQQLHHQEIDTILVAYVMEGTDVWVVERRDGPGFLFKATPCLRVGGEMRGKNLDSDFAS